MEKFVGTKVITAQPMNRLEYNEYRGWKLPVDEQHLADEAGMLVEYEDTEHPNVKGHAGYVSWSPLKVFAKAYQANGCLSFGAAIEMLKRGHKVSRSGWNGEGMWLVLMPSTENVMPNKESVYAKALNSDSVEGYKITINPHIDMFTATGQMQPGWLASQTDMLAEDWGVV